MKHILREPLVHFLVLGMGIFLVHGILPGPSGSEAREIVVSSGRIEHLSMGFERTWQRPPTPVELRGLIDDWVREEISTREAMALGLDRDDTVIRRRLRQKLEFVTEDMSADPEPTDADLRAYLEAHADAFRVEARFTFSHVYLDLARRGDDLVRDAARLLAQLRDAKADPSALGDSFLLERTFRSASSSEISKLFGEGFAASLGALALGQWEGPVQSGYGLHLVLVRERTEGRVPDLSEIRGDVAREWMNARRLAWTEECYQALLRGYHVTVEHPEPDAPAVAR